MLDYVGKDDGRGKSRKGSEADLKIDKLVGTNLRRIRIARGWTQESIGLELGMSFQAWQKYEGGHSRLTVILASRIARALKVSIEDLFQGTRVFGDTDILPVMPTLTGQAMELAMTHDAIVDPAQRTALRNLARTMAQAED